MIWEHFTFSAEIRMMAQRDTEELVRYIAKNLRSIARVSSSVAGYCGVDGIGSKPPAKLGDALDDALKIAGGEVILSQLTTHLAIACSEALARGIRPTAALKTEDYPGFDVVNKDLYKTLDEFGLIYNAYARRQGWLREGITRTQLLKPSSTGEGIPLEIDWKSDDTLNNVVIEHVIASEAFEAARASLISAICSQSSLIRGEEA